MNPVRARRILLLLSALAWVLVLCLAVEFAARGAGLLSERLYARFFEEQTSKVYRMVPAGEQPALAPVQLSEEQRSRLLEGPPALSASTPGRCPEDAAQRDAARNAFAAIDEEHRDIMATVRGEVHAEIELPFHLLDLWGDPLLAHALQSAVENQNLFNFNTDLAAALDRVQPGESIGPFPSTIQEYFATEARATCRAGATPGARIVELVVRNRNPALVPPSTPLGPEVASEIPGIRYKRNWFQQGAMASFNNYGFRDEDVVLPKPPGLYRIVCVGGSTTEEGNNNAHSYPNLMEQQLQAEFGSERVEVINCGISGINSYAECRRIEDYLELEPDLIVYYNGVNDATHVHMPRWRAMAPPGAKWIRLSALLTRVFNRSLLPPDEVISQYMRQTTFRHIRAMAYRAHECGVAFAVCSFAYPRLERLGFRDRVYLDMNFREVYSGGDLTYPTYTHVMDLHNALVREACQADGLYYIPVAETLDTGTDDFFDLCHTTPGGLEVKTGIITGYVRSIVASRLNP